MSINKSHNLSLQKGTAVYQSEEDEEERDESDRGVAAVGDGRDGSKTMRSDVEERALDPNHNFFVLVDSGVSDQAKGKEAELRARFERCISQWNCAAMALDQSVGGATGFGGNAPASGGITSSTQLQQQTQSGSNINNQSSILFQREGSTRISVAPQSGSGGNVSSGSVSKTQVGLGTVSTAVIAAQKIAGEQLSASQGTGMRTSGEKSLPDMNKPQKSGKSVGSEEEILVPMCGLVVGGDRFTLRQVYCSMIQNRCPIVVTKVSIITNRIRLTYLYLTF